ncbi:MAG: HEAT repeat domain-containing protein [Deferrisomatales bacterium]|nr:HEAT repeat domain-containing protein [Deferrisomatales bacterium]
MLFAGLVACGVPEPVNVETLKERLSEGDQAATVQLVELLGRAHGQDIRSEAYKVLQAAGEASRNAVLPACRDADPVRREHALALAASLKLPEAAGEALRALTDGGFPRRYVAAWVLGDLGDPAAGEPLVAALGDGDTETAREAARSLTKLGKPIVPVLLGALPSMGAEPRLYALRILGEVGDPAALESLVSSLAQAETRAVAAWALGKLGQTAAGPALMAHLSDPLWQVRLEVARALGFLGFQDAGASLDALRSSDPVIPVREWAARSLGLLQGTSQTYPDAQGKEVIPGSLFR